MTMSDLSSSAAFDLAIAQKSRMAGIPWACACCGAAGVMEWENESRIIDLMFIARQRHAGASPRCDGNPLVIEPAFVFRRCR
jgi:hypothetical protein